MANRIGVNFLLITFIAGLIMFFNLGGLPLLDPDEPVYAETPREMIKFDDFISPRIYGDYWYDKPPMYYWLVAAAFKLFGISEFAARFPSALLGVLCVLYIYYIGSELFNERAGLAGSLVLATSIEYFYLGKAAVTDITLTLCLTVSLLSFLTRRYYLGYIFAGLATVTKGPIGLLFPGAVMFLYLLFTGGFRELGKMKIPAGIVIYAIVAVPWYYVMYTLHGNPFIDTFLGFHNITRFTTPEHPEGVLWWYFIPVLILGFFPWTAVMVQAVWTALREGRNDAKPLLFLIIWAAFIFAFFSVSQTKLVSYILPMFPPLAMVVGWYIDRVWDSQRRGRPIAWAVVFTILSLLLVVALYFGVKQMPVLFAGGLVAGVLFLAMAVGVCYLVLRYDIGKAFWLKVAGMTLFSIILLTMLFPQAAPAFTTRDIAKEFTARYDGKSPVYVMKFLRPGFAFYSGVYGTEIKSGEEVSQKMAQSGKVYFVVRQSEYKNLPDNVKQRLATLAVADEKVLLLKQ